MQSRLTVDHEIGGNLNMSQSSKLYSRFDYVFRLQLQVSFPLTHVIYLTDPSKLENYVLYRHGDSPEFDFSVVHSRHSSRKKG